jgi:hypothetical protein
MEAIKIWHAMEGMSFSPTGLRLADSDELVKDAIYGAVCPGDILELGDGKFVVEKDRSLSCQTKRFNFFFKHSFLEDPLKWMDHILEGIGLKKEKIVKSYGAMANLQSHEWNNRDGENCDLIAVNSRRWDKNIPVYGFTYKDEDGESMDDWILKEFIPACKKLMSQAGEVNITYFENETGWWIE